MESFEKYFKDWINWKVEKQLKAIDTISIESGVDASEWFKNDFIKRQLNDYTGDDFLDVVLEDFVCHFAWEFDKLFEGCLPIVYTNIYGEKSHGTFMALEYNKKTVGIKIAKRYNTKEEIEDVENLIKSIPVEKRNDLMKNKLFSYVINQTNLEIFSKNDIRYLKLKNLQSYE